MNLHLVCISIVSDGSGIDKILYYHRKHKSNADNNYRNEEYFCGHSKMNKKYAELAATYYVLSSHTVEQRFNL